MEMMSSMKIVLSGELLGMFSRVVALTRIFPPGWRFS